ncbi:MAG: small multi-drug export protein [Dorea sp.]|nr:small multi-drug export protein [Dorea sp.]
MTETLVQGVIDALSGSFGKEAIVFIISMIPILELRGALLVAGPILGVPVAKAIPLCVVGNIIPVPFILLLITPIFNWLKKTKTFQPMVTKLENKAMSKSDQIEKYEFWGLVLFVGIPLPGTGAWTGSLIAALLGIKFKKAFPAVVIGICMATVIMWFISYVLLGGVQVMG